MKKLTFILALVLISGIALCQNEPDKTSKPTSIVFKSTVYDFGTLEYMEEATGEFIFKNVTKEPIKLTNVRASCGCTGTDWPREEIKRKKKASISVSYDTKRVGKFHKNVYVYVDGNPNPIQLEVKGEVLPSADGSHTNKIIQKTPKKVRIDASKKVNPKTNGSSTKSSIKSTEIKKTSESKTIKKEVKVKSETKTVEKQSSIKKSE